MNKFNYLRSRTIQMVVVLAIVVGLSLLEEFAPSIGNLAGEITSVAFCIISIGCVFIYFARTQGLPLPAMLQLASDVPVEEQAQINTRLLLLSIAIMASSLILLWLNRI